MQRKAIILGLLGVSVGGMAATQVGQLKVDRAPISRVAPPPVAVAPVAAAVQPVVQPRPMVSSAIASEIARWKALRQSDNLPFSSYASFLVTHRGWPGETALRRTAERQIQPGMVSAAEVVRFFSVHPPLTAGGHANYALALQASGQPNEALAQARQAWLAGAMPADVEARLLGTFGASLAPGHDRRMDVLLDNGDRQSALRLLPMTSPARRPIYEARLAIQTRAPDAQARYAALGPAAASEPGLLIDRARYMQDNGNPLGARQFLAQRRSLAAPPAEPAKFMETMVAAAQGAANDNQWAMAYQIASQVDDLYPQGTDISAKSFAERDEYTNLTWLAGTAALQRLGRPADAVGMFERYGRAAQSPQTQTKGLYWAGHAARAAGQAERAQAYWREAARHFDQFYGQLAAERLGQPVSRPPQPQAAVTPAQRQAFYNRPMVAAARYLGQLGQWRDQSEFVRALASSVETDAERELAGELGRELGRPDLGVLTARAARNAGSFNYGPWGFPQVQVPPAQAHAWSVIHGITRQESLFDREAISSAGARGLMQLMPGTARQVAGQLGLGYDQARLTRDPQYNVMLGSAYFADLLDDWGGSYPLAIASYNAGPGNVRRWVRENGDPRTPGVNMVEWIEKIPFFETRNYVQRVLENTVVYDMMSPQRARSPVNGRLSYYLGERIG